VKDKGWMGLKVLVRDDGGSGGGKGDVNPAKNNETQQRKGTQDRSIDKFKWKTSTHCL
jgi:hypothetical protein